jgi:small subunit ribosomal protein S7e
MFNRRDKIIKKDGSKPSDLEEEVAKSLHSLELNNKSLKMQFTTIFINSVENVEYEMADGTPSQYLLVRIPHRSFAALKKVGALIIEHLEDHFDKLVFVVANRTIISPSAKHHPTQMRPRSRTLTAVHKEILQDCVFPSNISGRSLRVNLEGKRIQKVMLDPLDKPDMEAKLDAICHVYQKLTTHKITLGFSKPSVFQQKIIDSRASK